jgi:Protein of unknown function (DUF2628)
MKMKAFKIYKHPISGHEAVKIGFSWPGFFFNVIWMLSKKLWGLAGFWFALYVVLSMIEIVADDSDSAPALQSIVYFALAGGYFALALAPGFKGSEWRTNNLEKRGFELIREVQAETPEGAIAQVVRATNA